MASWAGLTCVMPSVVDPLRGQAQPISGSAYTGTYWIFMHAGGGWDPTHLCDPKGRVNENENDPMGRFLRDDIRTAGNINYAPLGDDGTALDAFFQEHYQRLLVVNGMDTGTNGHDQGTRGTWSGRTEEGHPPIGALIAAAVYFTVGMSFRGSASSMQEVVKTEGNDIPHLMAALDSLASAFQVMGILILIGVTSVALSLVVLGGMFPNGTP